MGEEREREREREREGGGGREGGTDLPLAPKSNGMIKSLEAKN